MSGICLYFVCMLGDAQDVHVMHAEAARQLQLYLAFDTLVCTGSLI